MRECPEGENVVRKGPQLTLRDLPDGMGTGTIGRCREFLTLAKKGPDARLHRYCSIDPP